MKSLPILLLTCLSLTVSAQHADTILNRAFAQAAKEHKNVFLIFHASWCGWCKKMDRSMNDSVCKKSFTDNYVICHLDVEEQEEKKYLENEGGEAIKVKYGGKDQGLPYWVIFNGSKIYTTSMMPVGLDSTSMLKKENAGCPASKNEVIFFIDALKKTSSITKENLAIIAERFRKNQQ